MKTFSDFLEKRLTGKSVIGVVVVLLFGASLFVTFDKVIPQGSATMINILLGALVTNVNTIVNFYFGSAEERAAKAVNTGAQTQEQK